MERFLCSPANVHGISEEAAGQSFKLDLITLFLVPSSLLFQLLSSPSAPALPCWSWHHQLPMRQTL